MHLKTQRTTGSNPDAQHAESIREICLHMEIILSFLNTKMAQVVEILPHGIQGLAYLM